MRANVAAGLLTALLSLAFGRSSWAAADAERELNTDEITRWLDSPATEPAADRPTPAPDEAPPPAPRRSGVFIESGVGAAIPIGPLEHVTPISPRFHVQLGYEPFRFLGVFAEGDLHFSTTAYASTPPPARAFQLFGFGGGLRAKVQFVPSFGGFLEGSAGVARVSDNVLEVYGFRHSTEWSLYYGGRLGLDWYPANPHLAVTLHGGARSYAQGFERERSTETALAVLAGLALRYTF